MSNQPEYTVLVIRTDLLKQSKSLTSAGLRYMSEFAASVTLVNDVPKATVRKTSHTALPRDPMPIDTMCINLQTNVENGLRKLRKEGSEDATKT